MAFIATAIIGGTSIAGALIGAHAAGSAANAQVQGTDYAAQLQKQASDAALAEQQRQFDIQQANAKPFLQTGTAANAQLADLLGLTPNSTNPQAGYLAQQWTQKFQAPTDVTEQNDPGFQFRLQQGQQALERSAAARGNLLTGGTAKAIDRYAQDYASNEYNNVYNRQLGQYQQDYNIFQNNQSSLYNRLAGVSGAGQTAAGQLNSASQNAANNTSNILLNTGQMLGNDAQNAAAARASGYVGGANAIGGALGGIGSSVSQMVLLNSLLGGVGGGAAFPGMTPGMISGSFGGPTTVPTYPSQG